jgi:hypothetical protein
MLLYSSCVVAFIIQHTYYYISNINWDERSYKAYSSLVVPFSDDGNRVTLAMGCHHTLSINKHD